jgi:oxidase EvaA
VLCCTDWRTLSGGAGREGFGGALWRSLDSEPRPSLLRETQVRLDRLKQRAPTPMRRPVEHLDGWGFDAEGPVIMANGELALRQIEVHCATREAPHWDQPILQTLQEQIVELLCRNLDGTLEFAFRPYWEPGLVSGAELGPSFFRCPAGPTTPGIIRARVRQSDEGGRFYHTTAEYRIVEVAAGAGDGGLLWHRLSEVQATIGTAIFNNEARSALSVLLACL